MFLTFLQLKQHSLEYGQVNPAVAERFEVYFKGMELANGFHELSDVDEQAQRFERDLAKRSALGLNVLPVDKNFLAALQQGLH